MMVKKSALPFVVIAVVLFLFIGQARADLLNGDFSDGWDFDGVDVSGGIAVFSDSDHHTYLYKPVAGTIGATYLFSFDIKTDPSIYVVDFVFPDTFYASLYFSYENNTFNLNDSGTYVAPLPLLDVDAPNRVTVRDGDFTPIAASSGWSRYSLTFQNQYNFIIPTFELLNFNQTVSDSTISIDNVSLAKIVPVPEPTTILLFASGLVILAGFSRRKNTINSKT